jgi:sirohydrochlorin cobaltochelatase
MIRSGFHDVTQYIHEASGFRKRQCSFFRSAPEAGTLLKWKLLVFRILQLRRRSLIDVHLEMSGEFKDATLILVGHGSTVNVESAAPTYQHADELRRRGIFAEVLEAFWKQEPGIAGVLRGAFTPRIFIVPLFISEGYFTQEVIPRELGFCANGEMDFPRVQERRALPGSGLETQLLHYCGPVGTHDSMTAVLLARARQIVEKHPFPRAPQPNETALFIAGHGTGNNENSRKAIERQVELIRAKGVYAEVYPAFMEEEPRIGDCYAIAQARNIVMVPFFISDGLHSHEDIPVMLGEAERIVKRRHAEGQPTWRNPTEKKGKLLWYAPSIGNEPHIPDVILERVREAETWAAKVRDLT